MYHDILRAAQFFNYPNERGEAWRDVIVRSARQEFEANRLVTDPATIARLIISGRDALDQAIEASVGRHGHIRSLGETGPCWQSRRCVVRVMTALRLVFSFPAEGH